PPCLASRAAMALTCPSHSEAEESSLMANPVVLPDLPHVTVTPVQPLIGAAISGIEIANASTAELDLIHKALLRYKVIFFRDQHLTHAQHAALGRYFGELEIHPLSAHPDHPEMLALDSIGGMREGRQAPA